MLRKLFTLIHKYHICCSTRDTQINWKMDVDDYESHANLIVTFIKPAGHGSRSLERWDRGFEFQLGHGYLVCVRLFCVCVVLYLGRGLATGRSLAQGVLPILYRSKEK
jgi:hypothetical protein